MVGTAVYQVGRTSAIHVKKRRALKPVVQQTSPPADSGASVPAIKPWMWNSGMMLRPRSALENANVSRIWRADAHTLRWASGTILGREVVPEGFHTIPMSLGAGGPERS